FVSSCEGGFVVNMAPTIQTQAQREDGHRSGIVCRVKYCNSLPDIPFDPKFITYPFDQHRSQQHAKVVPWMRKTEYISTEFNRYGVSNEKVEVKGMMDEEGNQFVAYFLPNEETLRKRKRDCEEGLDYMPEDLYDYKIAREYNWNVKNKASKGYEENYFFIFRDGDGVYYNELETR
ncbi:hypothetical protein GOODEAATRI_021066, partial [Goodea atripinnis]